MAPLELGQKASSCRFRVSFYSILFCPSCTPPSPNPHLIQVTAGFSYVFKSLSIKAYSYFPTALSTLQNRFHSVLYQSQQSFSGNSHRQMF